MLFRNTLAQSVRLVLGQALSVIVAPLLIGRLGLTAFGIWAVTGAAVGYVSLLDLGVTKSLSRFVALYDARGDREAVRRCQAVGFLAVLVVGLLAMAAAVLLPGVVDDAVGNVIPTSDMRVVLLSSSSLLTLTLLGQVCSSLPTGLQRMVPPNVAGIFGNVCNFGASVGVLLIDPRLTSYAIANAAAGVPALVASFAAMVYVGGWRFLGRPSWGMARELVSFGIKTQVTVLAVLINTQTDKVVVAVAVGVRASAAYEIGARVAMAVRELAILSISAMIPTATAEIVRHGRAVIGRYYREWSRRVLALAVGVFVLAAVTSPYLLMAWIGPSASNAHGILIGLCIAYGAWMVTGVPYTISVSAGRPGLPARNEIGAALLNLLLTAGLAPLFGTWGVLAGTVLAMSVMGGAFVVQFHRAFGVPASAFTDAAVGPLTLGAVIALPVGLLVGLVLPSPTGRPEALLLLALVGGGFGLAYWFAATTLDYLPVRLRMPRVRVRAGAPVPASNPPD